MKNREKKVTIGIMGGVVNNSNMGCVALTYSLLQLLELISKRIGHGFCYYIFEDAPDRIKIEKMADELNIDESRIISKHNFFWDIKSLKGILSTAKRIKKGYPSILALKRCSVVIDLTQGDSFTDIYGKERFYNWTRMKNAVTFFGVPLILGPQTYGPFQDIHIKEMAKKVIEQAALVISRDELSVEYMNSFCTADVMIGTDLAFALQYHKNKDEKQESDKIKIGINPSGLLSKNRVDASKLETNIKSDYDLLIHQLIQRLKDSGKYEIHLISHVGNEAIQCFGNIEGVIYHEQFNSPIEAKNCIANMDIFIGARMHATIGSFSSGVATIPLAYSRKFSGVYHNIGYTSVVDLCTLETEDAIVAVLDLINDYANLQKEAKECMKTVKLRYKTMEDVLETTILQFI